MARKENKNYFVRYVLVGIMLGGLATPLQAGQRNANNNNVTFYDSSLVTFADGETATGLVVLAGGFTLDYNASSTFNVPVPISGPVTLGCQSVLTLTGDMYFDSSVLDLAVPPSTPAFIVGGGYTIHFGGDITLPGENGLYFINSDATLDGMGHTVSFALTTLNVAPGVILTLKNMTLRGPQNGFLSGGGTIVLQNVISNISIGDTWTMSTDDTDIEILDDVFIHGGGDVLWQGNGDLIIDKNSTLYFDSGITFYYEPSDFSRSHIVFTDGTSFLHFNDCTFQPSASGSYAGIQILKGTIFIENKVLFNNNSNTDPAKSIEFGDGSGIGNNATLKVLGGATLEVDGYLYQNPA